MIETFSADELETIRRAYAAQVIASAGVKEKRVETAYANVPRERFLSGNNWLLPLGPVGPSPLKSDNPVLAYQDKLLALNTAKGINNGSPALHAAMIESLDVQPGEHIAHIGAGTGYYSAILAELVGAKGHVLAVEYDPVLAGFAKQALEDRDNVTVICGDGAAYPVEPVDAVYVNFASDRPADRWIEGLRSGGSLLFQLGSPMRSPEVGGPIYGNGGAFLVRREVQGFSAQYLLRTAFIFSEGDLSARDSSSGRDTLQAAFQNGPAEQVQSLLWKELIDPEQCWFVGNDWALSYQPPGLWQLS